MSETYTTSPSAVTKMTVRFQCPGITKKGKQCSRYLDASNDVFGIYPRKCWQHDIPVTGREDCHK